MKIIIAGAGKVGSTLTKVLSADGHDITLIDSKKEALNAACQLYDVMGLEGNCATLDALTQAGAAEADLLIAVTNADEVNLLCCVTSGGSISVKGSNATVAEVKANGRIDMSKDSKTLGYCNCNNHVWTAAIIFCNLFKF